MRQFKLRMMMFFEIGKFPQHPSAGTSIRLPSGAGNMMILFIKREEFESFILESQLGPEMPRKTLRSARNDFMFDTIVYPSHYGRFRMWGCKNSRTEHILWVGKK